MEITDFSNTNLANLVLFNILLYVVIVTILFKYLKKVSVSQTFAKIAFVLFIIFCTFSFWGTDYFHYLNSFLSYVQGDVRDTTEDVYLEIAQFAKDYSLFRVIIWGGSCLLCGYICRILRLPLGTFLLVLCGVFITIFSYARATLAMSICFAGFVLFVSSTNMVNKIIALLLLCCSFYFHKSALFGIVTSVGVLILYSKPKFIIRGMLYGLPILIFVASFFLSKILSMSSSDLLDLESAQNYLTSQNTRSSGIAAIIANTLSYSVFYLIVWIYIKNLFLNRCQYWSKTMKIFGFASFLIVYCATIFIFDLGANTSVVYYRFLFFAMIPCSVFLTYCINERVDFSMATKIVYLGIVASLYKLLYSMYLYQ